MATRSRTTESKPKAKTTKAAAAAATKPAKATTKAVKPAVKATKPAVKAAKPAPKVEKAAVKVAPPPPPPPKPKRRRRVSEAMEALAHHYLGDEIMEVLLNRGHALKASELAAEVLVGEFDPKLLRKAMASSSRFSVQDRRWNLAMRQMTERPLLGALEYHLRSYGRPLPLTLLANEMAVIAKQPISADEYQFLLPRLMGVRPQFFRTSDDKWGLREWLLDVTEQAIDDVMMRNFFLASDQTLKLIEKLDAACPSARASEQSMAAAMIEAADGPVPHKIVAFVTWKRRGEQFDPVTNFEQLLAESRLHLLSGAEWMPGARVPLVMAAMRELSKEAALEEVELLPGEEMAAAEELVVSPADLEEIHLLLAERKRPVPTAELVIKIFELSPNSPSFPVAVETVNESLTQDESLERMGKATWGVSAFAPEHIQDIPEVLMIAEAPTEGMEDTEADIVLEDEGLEDGLATWVHDPRYEDFGEEDEIELAPDHVAAEDIRYPLPYDHWRAGTIKIREADRDFFPPETQLVYATMHPAGGAEFNAWVNQFSTLIYDLAPYYKKAGAMPGSIVAITRGDMLDHYDLSIEKAPDPLLALDADRIKHLESLRKQADEGPWSVFEIMCRVLADHSKGLHFMQLWGEVNVVRRTPRRVVASNLSSYHCFYPRPAGSENWVYDERKVEQGHKKAKRKYMRK